MPAPPRSRLVRAALGAALPLVLGLAACGGDIDVKPADREAAVLFNERCSGCHSLTSANAYGSKPPGQLAGGERTNGPNFDQRKTSREDALFAIRNGGFSGAIMPANIIVGDEAEKVADFLSRYSGKGSGDGGGDDGGAGQ
ncbi:MAG: c-type cytochrome [Thermoleophilaceae bacterium]